MQNKYALVAIIIVVLIGMVFFINKSSDKDIPNEVESVASVEKGTNSGSYEPYSQELLARAESGKVVLFFRASWCPTCRTLNADIRKNLDDIPEWLTILDVDYDNSTALKQKYGVTYQHTLVQVDAEGNQLGKWARSTTLDDLLANIK